MSILRKLFGAAPTPAEDGAFSPSPLALKLATSSKTDYDGGAYDNPYEGGQLRVLIVCTEERDMVMANGKTFSTGNQICLTYRKVVSPEAGHRAFEHFVV